MTDGTGRRPFSALGDHQLLDHTKRLAANHRGLEVHILDHLEEIDRRGLALLPRSAWAACVAKLSG